MSGYVYAFGVDYNMLYPLSYCLLGSIIAGIYSTWLYRPISNNLIMQD